MKECKLTWRSAAVHIAVWCGSMSVCLASGTKLPGPSDRPEAYFNGSSYVRITRPLDLTQLVGLSFRTCVGGELFSQRYEGHSVHVTALADKLVVQWARPGSGPRAAAWPARTLDNQWHWVALRYRAQPPALMLQVDHDDTVISNSSWSPWVLGPETSGAVLLVGNVFSGCVHEGPQLEFHAASATPNNVLFGACPLTTDACKDHKDVLRIPPKDHCYNEPCLRHGTCISRHDRYECHCAARYTGNNCEVDRGPPCASSPCRHGGACEETSRGDYRCVCPPHYHGELCELEVSLDPACVAAPCLHNGSCSVPAPGAPYVCDCLPGFTGRNCETDVDECAEAGAVCQHGGRCVDGSNHYSCDCSDTGYSGPHCENNVNECQEVRGACGPGLCYDTYGGFVCVCPSPYTGDRCQKVSGCASAPCGPDAECADTEAGPACCARCPPHAACRAPGQCVCEPGYIGAPGPAAVCARPQSACEAGVCLHGATCRAGHQHFNCTCAPGYTGAFCELSAGPERCALQPCLHALACTDTSTGFECSCAAGWTGARCDVPAECGCEHGDCRGGACVCAPGWGGALCDLPADCRARGCAAPQECVESAGAWACAGSDCGGGCHNGSCVGDACHCPPGVTGRFCEIDIDECAQKPKICNYGVCVNVPGSYECYCKPGYTGDRCEQDIDECLSAPCKNNGTCLNLENNYECTCMKGFQGKDCSVDINECASSPCAAGSTCVDGVAAYSCVCQEGLTGPHCEIDIDDCESGPCANGGRCIDGLNAFSCACAGTGYSGRSCEHNIDECAPLPCRNGGTCQDLNNDYRCLCHAAYTGKDCEIDVDECSSAPCQFGGVCLQRSNTSLYRPPGAPAEQAGPQPYMLLPQTFYQPFSPDTAAGFECVCVLGTTGARCDVNVDECASSPCVHGACEDRVGGYQCACLPGYEGDHCQLDVDECERYTPCAHGTCHDRLASYYCACASGYGGTNCSVPLTGCDPEPCGARGQCLPWLRHETEHRFNCSCDSGYHGDTCQKITTMSLEKSSFAEVNTSREEGYDISFRFKTTLGNGLLAMGRGLTYFFLELSSGRLNLHSSLLNKWEGVFIGSNLNDSNWQKVFVSINSSHLVLAANEEQTIYPISQNEAYNSSVTSFPSTRLGTAGSSYATLTHGPNFFVGCFQDVVVNGQWVLPEETNGTTETPPAHAAESVLRGVRAACPRTPQCEPNPCRSGGVCEDRWTAYTCTCPRPYLGHMCQHNYTAATFLHESATGRTPVRAAASEPARLALLSAVDISMFVRTRKPTGTVFYLGSGPGSPEETMMSASLRGGELLVHLRFRSAPEEYAVGGTRLDNGFLHLIQLVRNATLVQVKLNGTEYFRKSISAAKQLDAQVLYLGGPPSPAAADPAGASTTTTTTSKPGPNDDDQYFKGIIQDVQISNGMTPYVVEFFPLSEAGLALPPAFGEVRLDARSVLRGVRSDDACAHTPCTHNATCAVTWNDYVCSCPRGYKGKQCEEVEFCQLQGCPLNSECRDLRGGYECISNATFDGVNTTLTYEMKAYDDKHSPDSVSIKYRSMTGGTLLYAWLTEKDDTWWFAVGAHGPQVSVAWRLAGADPQQRFMRHARDHTQWTTLHFSLSAHQIRGSFVWESGPEVGISAALNTSAWRRLVTRGQLRLGGVREHNTTMVTTTSSTASSTMESLLTTTEDWSGDNSVGEHFKGCMGEVRVGGLLLPYFAEEQLLVGAGAEAARGAARWALAAGRAWGAAAGLGCVLCLERDCRHGGRCADLRHAFSCACPRGYSGLHCETDVDECQSHVCQNNATCRDGLDAYSCECQQGFSGEYCEQDVDECESSPCLHNGTCSNTQGGFHCACAGDWAGDTCQRPLRTSCRHRPCHPRAACHDRPDPATGNNYTCACAPGFEGVHCETAFCETRPCLHGACLTNDTEPQCWCEAGYTGMYCELEVDECVEAGSTACLHGGRCQDRLAGYYCDCDNTGWQGAHCEVDVDECASGRVNCGPGECRNHDGGYTCQCGAGFCGHECKLRDPCYGPAPEPGAGPSGAGPNGTGPCLHGGACEQRCADTEQYVCVCARGWGGTHCDQQIASSESSSSSSALVAALAAALAVGVLAAALAALSAQARRKRATRGTYSPSGQEYCNPRAEQHSALKPPPEERLI